MSDNLTDFWEDLNAEHAAQASSAQDSQGSQPMPPEPPTRAASFHRSERKSARQRAGRSTRSSHSRRHQHEVMNNASRRRAAHSHRGRNVLIVLLCLALVAGLGWYGYRRLSSWIERRSANTVMQDYMGPGQGHVAFTIMTGESVASIGKHLQQERIVKSSATFASIVAANNATLYPGTYDLQHEMPSSAVIAILSDQRKAKGFLNVRSGERVEQVAADIATLLQLSAQSVHETMVQARAALPPEAQGSLEGWFEPGSYDIKAVGSARAMVRQLIAKRVAKLDALGAPRGEQRERTLIIASIAQAEVNTPEYYGKTVRVILNRLAQGMPLGMDSTVAYGAHVSGTKLTDAMLADASNPYNSRVFKGLPPTPIANPGDDTISATLNPPQGQWLYFVTTNLTTGETKFVNTEAEFWAIRDEYKRNNAQAN